MNARAPSPVIATDQFFLRSRLIEIMGGDHAAVDEILADFREILHQLIVELRVCSEAGDVVGLRQLARMIKRRSLQIYARGTASLAGALEEAIDRQPLGIVASVARLERGLDDLFDAISHHRNGRGDWATVSKSA